MNHKKPNGGEKTIELLKQEIYEKDFFRIFYTSDKKPKFIAEIIDIATSQQELDDSKWSEKYPNIKWYSSEFVNYNDDTKNASWIYLARKIYAVNPDDYSDFKYFNGYGYPSVGCQAPIISFKTKKEKEKEIKMENTLKLLKYKKQIILQGPPGTGKTREAKQIAKALLNITEDKNLKNGEQFQIIQFHPSYSYEDFVRGIVAKPNSNGDGITYEAENKILVKIAERAWKNYKASSFSIDESDSISKDIWIDDKFNDFKSEIEKDVEEKEIPLSGNITIFKVDYDSFRYGKDWQTPSRINFTDFKNIIKAVLNGTYSISSQQIPKEISLHAHYRYTYYNALLKNFFDKYKYKKPVTKQDLKNFVLIIDEINRANLSSVLGELIYALEYRGEAVDSMYAVDRSNKITLPPNLYIIGTMNTADRSVGHIDYAVRRRFAFIDVLPRDLWSELKKNFNSEKFNAVADLFDKHLSQEFRKEEVQLGHSYFITENTDIQTRLQYEIKPILREYIKDGVLKESASDEIEKL